MSITPEQVEAGQSIYTKRTLGAYDSIVLGASNRLFWRCPTQQLVEHYNKHVTANHPGPVQGMDVGPGRTEAPSRLPEKTAPNVASVPS